MARVAGGGANSACGRCGLMRSTVAVAISLSVLFVCLSMPGLNGALDELDIETCKADRGETAPDGQVWKLLREFRRLVQGRPLKDKQFAWIDNTGNTIKLSKEASPAESAHAKKTKSTDGTLKITIVGSTDLHTSDWFSHADPYVQCGIVDNPDVFFVTPRLSNAQHPVWNYETEIEYTPSLVTLKCEVFDAKEWFGANEKVGEVSIPTQELVQSAGNEKAYNLLNSVSAATLTVKATLIPHFSFGCTARVRKDWNDLAAGEKTLYLEAVNKIKTTARVGKTDAGPGNNIYDTFVMIHGEGANKGYAHQTAGFFAWHRKFLIEYEDALRGVEEKFKCVTLPYWDWTTETFECTSSTGTPCTTYHEASQLLSDFGGPGNPDSVENTHGSSGSGAVGCVTTGPFAGWVDQNGACLSRGVNWNIAAQKPFTGRTRMLEIMTLDEYGSDWGFRGVLEGVPHGSTHNYLGGHMRSFISPADPIFFSHHTYVDKLYAVWQDCHDFDTLEVKNELDASPDDSGLHKYYKPSECYGAKTEDGSCSSQDRVTDPMPFYLTVDYKPSTTPDPTCETAQGDDASQAACKSCVHGIDIWCKGRSWIGGWDEQCCSHRYMDECCSACGVCPVTPVEECSAYSEATNPAGFAEKCINMASTGNTILKDWKVDVGKTPVTMNSVHHMPEGRSYSYADDEIERHLKEHVTDAFAGCKLDSHAKAQADHGVLAETQRLHHEGTRHGKAAFAYAMMVQQAFNETKKLSKKKGLLLQTDHAQVHKDGLRSALKMECKEMAGSCADYRAKYNCNVDQPRYWLGTWMSAAKWSATMADPVLKAEVFQDPCCAGDLSALEPGEVHSGSSADSTTKQP